MAEPMREATQDPATDDPVIDPTTFAALAQMAGADFVDELVDTFLEEAPQMLADLRAAAAEHDADRFRRAAHSLKSNAMTFGALSVGFDRTTDRFSLSAYGRFNYLNADLDPYREAGGGLYDLAFARRHLDSYAGSLGPNDRRVSPIHGPLIGLGRTLVLTGTRDVVNPDARRLAAALHASGARVELLERHGLLHNFPLLPIPEAAPARDAIVAFLKGGSAR